MAYTKKDGTVVTDEWMDAVAEAAEKDELSGVVLATETRSGCPEMHASGGVTKAAPSDTSAHGLQ